MFEEDDGDDDDDEVYSEYDLNLDSNYVEEWQSDIISGDYNYFDDKSKGRSYNKSSNRGNRTIVYNDAIKIKAKKEPIFKEKKLAFEEVE